MTRRVYAASHSPLRLFYLRVFCSASLVISLNDEELIALKFLGPGECLGPFACLSLTYRYVLRRCSAGH